MTSVRARIGRNEKETVTRKSVQNMSSLELSKTGSRSNTTYLKICWQFVKGVKAIETWRKLSAVMIELNSELSIPGLFMPWEISNHKNNPAHTRMITTRQRLLPPIHICGSCPASCSHSHLARLTLKTDKTFYEGRQTNTIMCENLYCICISSEKEGTNNENM